MQKSKESGRNAYKNAWRRENQERISLQFEKIQNISERVANAGKSKGLSASAYMKHAILDALERDGY